MDALRNTGKDYEDKCKEDQYHESEQKWKQMKRRQCNQYNESWTSSRARETVLLFGITNLS